MQRQNAKSTGKRVSSSSLPTKLSSESDVWFEVRRLLQGFVLGLVVFSFITVFSSRVEVPTFSKTTESNPATLSVKNSPEELEQAWTELREREQELQQRAEYLDAVLSEAGALDLGSEIKGKTSSFPIEADGEDGIGGGDLDEEFTHTQAYLRRSDVLVSRLNIDEGDGKQYLDFQIDRLKSFPIGSPVPEARITSQFGKRRSPFSGRWRKHHGVDFAAHWRSSVISTADGVVVSAGYKGAYGRQIVIDHGNGIKTVYGHLSKIKVRKGDRVCRGERIGWLGSTGRSTGPHLHYEVRVDGEPVDPMKYVQLAGLFKLL